VTGHGYYVAEVCTWKSGRGRYAHIFRHFSFLIIGEDREEGGALEILDINRLIVREARVHSNTFKRRCFFRVLHSLSKKLRNSNHQGCASKISIHDKRTNDREAKVLLS